MAKDNELGEGSQPTGFYAYGRFVGIRQQDKKRREPDARTGELTFRVYSVVLDMEPGTLYVDAFTEAEARAAVVGAAIDDYVSVHVVGTVRNGRQFWKVAGGAEADHSQESGWLAV